MSKQTLAIIAAAVLLIGGAGAWIGRATMNPDVRALAGQTFTETKEVVKVQKVRVPIKEIQVIYKDKIIEKLPIPQAVKDDPAQQIIATGSIEPDRNRGNVEAVATVNTATGNGAILMRQKGRSWLGLPNEKEIGIGYGIDSKGNQCATVYGRWDVLRIGGVVIHAYGEINQTPDARVQLRAGYRF